MESQEKQSFRDLTPTERLIMKLKINFDEDIREHEKEYQELYQKLIPEESIDFSQRGKLKTVYDSHSQDIHDKM